jgi:uncharacterized protein (DUF1778 family)
MQAKYGHCPYKESMVVLARSTRRKAERLQLRLEADRRQLLDSAAAASGMSTSAFVLAHATEAASQVLADRTVFVLPPDRWNTFVELLDRPEQPVEGLAAFLARPSILEPE